MVQELVIPNIMTASMGFAVFLLGARLTRNVPFLQEFNIPEAVTGGLIASVFFGMFGWLSNWDLVFELEARDFFMVLFFAGIGLNARLNDLMGGGRTLVLLLLLTFAAIVLQNGIGVAGAWLFGFPVQSGVLFGSAALIGGHGTAIAWSGEVAEVTGLAASAELGVAVATLGLILAAVLGGPIAKYLVNRHNLQPAHPEEHLSVGVPFDALPDEDEITHVSLTRVALALCLSLITGYYLHAGLNEAGLKLPLFVPCLVMGIVIGNLHSGLFPKAEAISRTPTLGVVTEFALGAFLAISLMTLDLSELAELGPAIIGTIGLQAIVTVVFVIVVLFPILGGQYRAAVLASGFTGFSLGATPTAIANMTAVTKHYGPSPIAFVVLPLVSAFFVDIANAIVIQMIVNF